MLLVSACAVGQDSGAALEGFSPVQALQIVDCRLPGQVRAVGGRSYLTPRRPTQTTAQDCRARGGELLLYDRASYSAALAVWLPLAEDGDSEAQSIVGEIYERGLAGEPNYQAAVEWYRRAAEQGYARAQFNLGTLYEQGLGVPADPLAALNWYRRASGLAADSVIFRSAAAAAEDELRAELQTEIEQRDRQIDVLNRNIEELNRRLEQSAEDAASVGSELDSVRLLLEQLESAQEAATAALASIPRTTAPPRVAQSFEEPEQIEYRRRDFGRFYALIVGVQEYDQLDDLASPANDVREVGRVLEEKYGFSVITLANPDQLQLMRAVNQLSETLREDDNLLIYFAGHGSRLQSGALETGYWLPRNAEPPPDDTLWVPNEFVSRHLGRVAAQRTLVISDSCYSGLLGNDPGFVMIGDGVYSDEYIEWKMPKRSRLVLSSGADEPVLGSADERHSIFATALLDALNGNEQVLTAPELFLRVRQRVRLAAAGGDVPLEPELHALKAAGHEVGDFFLIPTQD